MNRLNLLLVASLAVLTVAAHADTVVNLNATLYGNPNDLEPANNLAPSFYQTLQLAAGTYTVTALNGVYSGWDKNTGNAWSERTGLSTDGTTTFSNAGGINTYSPYPNSDQQLFTGDYSTAALAFAAGTPATFTLSQAGEVTFYIPDQSDPTGKTNAYTGFYDNQGGVSLDIHAVTPEPSSLVLLGTGALGLAGAVRRRLAK